MTSLGERCHRQLPATVTQPSGRQSGPTAPHGHTAAHSYHFTTAVMMKHHGSVQHTHHRQTESRGPGASEGLKTRAAW